MPHNRELFTLWFLSTDSGVVYPEVVYHAYQTPALLMSTPTSAYSKLIMADVKVEQCISIANGMLV